MPWPSPKDKVLYRSVLPADFRTAVKGQGVGRTVAVEASPWLEDNQWLIDLAATAPEIVGVVGRIDVSDAKFVGNLTRYVKSPVFRGIRIGLPEVRAAVGDKSVRDRLGRLGDNGLTLDVNGGPDTPAAVARLAGLLPKVRIVVNHAGNVRIDGRPPPADWRAGMAAAAGHENVYCKVSALVEATRRPAGEAPADVSFYRPELDALWEMFGDDRLIYASNWPVCEQAAPYSRVIGIVRDYLKPAPRAKADKFFTRNAEAAYRLPAPKPD